MNIHRIITNPLKYLKNTVTPLDRLKGFRTKNKPKIGWCGVFPPYQNGAASVSYYFVRELLKRKDIEVGLIPINNKIRKGSFKNAVFCKLDDYHLDITIFWCLGHDFDKYASKAKSTKARFKKIAWQTVHYGIKEHEAEKQIDEVSKADLKVFMTRWAVKEADKIFKRTAYVPFGVDTEYFKPSERKNKNAGNNTFEVIFVSRIHYYKGVMPFLDTMPLVIEKCPDVVFRLHSPLDKFSPHIREMKKAIAEMKRRYPKNFYHNVSWIPYNKVRDIYKSASVLVFPSNNEGFGVPLIEAMSCEIPCIVADIPPMNEIVTKDTGFCLKQKKIHEYHGFEFPDPADIAEKIIYLRNNKNILDEMGKKCRNHVKKNYELKECVDQFVDIVKKEIKKDKSTKKYSELSK